MKFNTPGTPETPHFDLGSHFRSLNEKENIPIEVVWDAFDKLDAYINEFSRGGINLVAEIQRNMFSETAVEFLSLMSSDRVYQIEDWWMGHQIARLLKELQTHEQLVIPCPLCGDSPNERGFQVDNPRSGLKMHLHGSRGAKCEITEAAIELMRIRIGRKQATGHVIPFCKPQD